MRLQNKLVHDISKILLHYGAKHQKHKTIEELNELVDAIGDEMYCDGTREHVKEEIADVYVMLEQLKKIYHFTDMEIEEVMKLKVARQHKRIENEK